MIVDVEASWYCESVRGVSVQVAGMERGVVVQEGMISFAGTVGGGKGFTAA